MSRAAPAPMHKPVPAGVGWMTGVDRRVAHLIEAVQSSRWGADLLLGLAVAILLAYSFLVAGYDASELTTGDSLYPVQMLDFGWLDYRPPPPNRLVPDIAVHEVVSLFTVDPLAQKLWAGVALASLTILAIGLWKSPMVLAVALAILMSHGFGFMNSATHFSLPLTVLAVQLARSRPRLEAAAILLVVFSNLLVVIPLAVMALAPSERARLPLRAAAAASGGFAACLYCEFGESVLHIAVVLPAWIAALALAERLGLRVTMSAIFVVMLPIAVALGLIPDRYGIPVALGLLIAITPLVAPRLDWRAPAAAAVLSLAFLATLDTARASRLVNEFDCLATSLEERGIRAVATDHWTAKPLYFAVRERGLPLTIAQTDFVESDSQLWMAPSSFYGQPTEWGIRTPESCALIGQTSSMCAQATVAPVIAKDSLCGGAFELYRYASLVPAHFEGRPSGKLASIARHLRHYIRKSTTIITR